MTTSLLNAFQFHKIIGYIRLKIFFAHMFIYNCSTNVTSTEYFTYFINIKKDL